MSAYQKVRIVFLLAAAVLVALNIYDKISPIYTIALLLVYLLVLSIGVFNLYLGFFVPVKYKGSGSQPVIALTFDDGPIAEKTGKILDILSARNVKATFFCIGNRIVANPDIIVRIEREGHLVGNHTYSHSTTIDLYPASRIFQELLHTDDAIEEVLGKKPRFFRPPYGVTNPMIAKAVKSLKHVVVGWSLRSFDTMIKDPSKLLKRTARKLKAGDVVLFHDYSDSTISMLPAFLDYVSSKGFKIVPLDVLLNEKPYR